VTRSNAAVLAREHEPKQLCTFLVESMLFGIDVTRVQEVIRGQAMTPVPLAPPMIEGLINLRGQIVSAIDLRRLLQLPSRPEGATPLNVVVRDGEGAVSLLVDEIGDVLEVDERSFEPPPDTLSAASKTLIEGVYKLEQGLLLLLNTELAVRVDWRASAEGRVHGK
jgi:purine-binding chemotaxis protein CheW